MSFSRKTITKERIQTRQHNYPKTYWKSWNRLRNQTEVLPVVGRKRKHIRWAPFWFTGSACAVKCPYRKGFWVYVLFLPSSSKVRQMSMCSRYLKLSRQSLLIIFPKDMTCRELLSPLTFRVLDLFNLRGELKNLDVHYSDHRNLQPDNNFVIRRSFLL